MAVLGLGALTVVLDPGSVKSYSNEVEYAKARGHELRTGKQHRCNDRLEDFIQVGHTGGRQACTVALLRLRGRSTRLHAWHVMRPTNGCSRAELQAIASEEGSIVRDFMPTAWLLGRCMMSKQG